MRRILQYFNCYSFLSEDWYTCFICVNYSLFECQLVNNSSAPLSFLYPISLTRLWLTHPQFLRWAGTLSHCRGIAKRQDETAMDWFLLILQLNLGLDN